MTPTINCPCHEPAYDEKDFQRIFGDGDEQQVEPVDIYQDWDDSGHDREAFA